MGGRQSSAVANNTAGAMITSIPPLIIFIFLGRYFIAGLVAGTLKGQESTGDPLVEILPYGIPSAAR